MVPIAENNFSQNCAHPGSGSSAPAENLFEAVAAKAPVMLVHCDHQHRFLLVNRAYAKRFDLAPSDIAGRHVSELIGKPAYEAIRPFMERALAGEEVEFELEMPYATLGRLWSHIAYVPDRDEHGRIRGLIAAITDVTDRRRAEAALEFLAKAGTELTHVLDYNGTLQLIARLSGSRLAEFAVIDLLLPDGKVQRAAWHSEDARIRQLLDSVIEYDPPLASAEHPISRVIRTGKPEFVPETNAAWRQRIAASAKHEDYIRKLGLTSLVSVRLDGRNRTFGVLTFGRVHQPCFIESELKVLVEFGQRAGAALEAARLHEELARSEQFNRGIIESSRDCLTVVDRDGLLHMINGKGCQLFGLDSPGSCIGRNWLALWAETDHARANSALQNAINTGIGHFTGSPAGESAPRCWDVLITPIQPLSDADRFLVAARDITERRTAQAALEESQKRLSLAAEAAQLGIWEYIPHASSFTLSDRCKAQLGLANGTQFAYDTLLESIHLDDRDRIDRLVQDTLKSGRQGDFSCEFRAVWPDGSEHWIAARGRAEFVEANGRSVVSRFLGTSLDVTDAKRTEAALRESEERLRAALTASETGTFRWDIRNNTLDWDEPLDRLFGLAPGQTARSLGQFIALVHPDDRAGVVAACEQCARNGADFDREFRVVWPDGSTHWISDKGKTILGAEGRPAYMTGACVGITGRKHAEAHARNQRDILEQIVRGASLPAILDLLASSVERHAQRKLIATISLLAPDGKTLHPAAGRSAPFEWVDYIRNLVIGPAVGSCGTAAFRGETVIASDISTDPLWTPYKDEALKHGLRACWSSPIKSSGGEVLGTFAVYYTEPAEPTSREVEVVDIAIRTASIAIERKRSEQALEEAQAKLKLHAEKLEAHVAERTASLREAVSQMEEFSYTVSHDLRAPLRGMQAYSQALLDDYSANLPDEARHFLERLHSNASRLDRMVVDLLTFSRVAGQDLRMEEVSLDKLVREIIQNYPEMQAPRAQITLDPLAPVFGHEPSLTQAISNLLNNAIKFVPPGVVPKVHIRTETTGSKVRLWIEDNGIGIEPRHQHRLFGMFERVHPHQAFEGSGVGLAIVRKAVERMDGQSGVVSDGVSGSKFWIELKAAAGK